MLLDMVNNTTAARNPRCSSRGKYIQEPFAAIYGAKTFWGS